MPGHLDAHARRTVRREVLEHRGAKAAREDILLRGEQQRVRGSRPREQRGIERLDEARVHDPDAPPLGLERPRRLQRRLDAHAHGEQRQVAAGAQGLPAADRQRLGILRDRHADAGAARVAQRDRPVVQQRGAEQARELRPRPSARR